MSNPLTTIPFIKMDGCGNVFVIIDARTTPLAVPNLAAMASALAAKSHPQTGGCDQVIILEPSNIADCLMRIFNIDGSESGACGNASRCVAWWLAKDELPGGIFLQSSDSNPSELTTSITKTIATSAGLLTAKIRSVNDITIDMGRPITDWRHIPLSRECDTDNVLLEMGELHQGIAVNMGNPHIVFFVASPDAVPLETVGPQIETNSLFPERINVSVAKVQGRDIFLRVWERGAGLTAACGTAACATFVAAQRTNKLTTNSAHIHLPGGTLFISRNHNGHIMMSGPIHYHFESQATL